MSKSPPRTNPARIIRMRELTERVGMCRSQIYNLIDAGEFPRQIRLSSRCVGFYESEIDEWIVTRQRVGSNCDAG
jgi:prophage regulatory protein